MVLTLSIIIQMNATGQNLPVLLFITDAVQGGSDFVSVNELQKRVIQMKASKKSSFFKR